MTTALLLQDLTVNPPFNSHIPSKPCIRPLVPGWATCAAAAAAAASETDGGSGRQQRSTVAPLPSNTPETSEYSLPRIPFTKKGEYQGIARRVGRASPASELRHCLRQSREFHWLGVGAPSDTAAVAKELQELRVTSVRGSW